MVGRRCVGPLIAEHRPRPPGRRRQDPRPDPRRPTPHLRGRPDRRRCRCRCRCRCPSRSPPRRPRPVPARRRTVPWAPDEPRGSNTTRTTATSATPACATPSAPTPPSTPPRARSAPAPWPTSALAGTTWSPVASKSNSQLTATRKAPTALGTATAWAALVLLVSTGHRARCRRRRRVRPAHRLRCAQHHRARGSRFPAAPLAVGDRHRFLAVSGPWRARRGAARIPETGPEGVSVNDATFCYPGTDRPALDGVSLDLKRSDVVALVGESGSGKIPVAELLTGQYRHPRRSRSLRRRRRHRPAPQRPRHLPRPLLVGRARPLWRPGAAARHRPRLPPRRACPCHGRTDRRSRRLR